jgi:CheY-like chemotaxis protein
MPTLGGRAAYDVISRKYPRIKVLFASGYSPSTVHTNFILDQGLQLIKKPYQPEQLLRKVRELLNPGP